MIHRSVETVVVTFFLVLSSMSYAEVSGFAPVAVELPESIVHGSITQGISRKARAMAMVQYVDFTGDRIAEGVVHIHGTNADTGSDVTLFLDFRLINSHYEQGWSYTVGEYPEGMEFLDPNGDSVSEVGIRAMAGNHFSTAKKAESPKTNLKQNRSRFNLSHKTPNPSLFPEGK